MISLSEVSLQYSDECALNNISLHIKKGSFITLVGASGSGKTSLLSVLSGIRQASKGEVLIDGTALTKPRLTTAYLLQDYGLLPWKRVLENINFCFPQHGIMNEDSQIEHYSKLLGIRDYYDRFPNQLSGGQKQRVALTRALCLKSDLLLMDEAFSALDSLTKESLQEVLLQIHNKERQTIIFVTHNIEEAVFLGKQIFVMKDGSITNMIENESQGQRETFGYFDMCQKIRSILHD